MGHNAGGNNRVIGYGLVLLAGICFTAQNLIVRVLFNPVDLFGIYGTGGFVAPTLPNSLLLLFMRMAMGGGLLMFLYLALLYVSIGQIATGIALTLFFTFPVFTALFSWVWFGAIPSPFQGGIMGLILFGSWLTLPHQGGAPLDSWLGVGFGLASGVTYAVYTVVVQKSFEQFHPVPFTWISFTTTLVLSALSLLVWHGQLEGLPWTALWIGGLLSAMATFAGHILNNLGIRLVGATAAAMLGAANPALTALFAWMGLQEELSGLQVMGVGLVVASVAALSVRRYPRE